MSPIRWPTNDICALQLPRLPGRIGRFDDAGQVEREGDTGVVGCPRLGKCDPALERYGGIGFDVEVVPGGRSILQGPQTQPRRVIGRREVMLIRVEMLQPAERPIPGPAIAEPAGDSPRSQSRSAQTRRPLRRGSGGGRSPPRRLPPAAGPSTSRAGWRTTGGVR